MEELFINTLEVATVFSLEASGRLTHVPGWKKGTTHKVLYSAKCWMHPALITLGPSGDISNMELEVCTLSIIGCP